MFVRGTIQIQNCVPEFPAEILLRWRPDVLEQPRLGEPPHHLIGVSSSASRSARLARFSTGSPVEFAGHAVERCLQGLIPTRVSRSDASGGDSFTMGAAADSFYEYLLKVWLQGGRSEPMYRRMYDAAMDGMTSKLLKRSRESIIAIQQASKGIHEIIDTISEIAGEAIEPWKLRSPPTDRHRPVWWSP